MPVPAHASASGAVAVASNRARESGWQFDIAGAEARLAAGKPSERERNVAEAAQQRSDIAPAARAAPPAGASWAVLCASATISAHYTSEIAKA